MIKVDNDHSILRFFRFNDGQIEEEENKFSDFYAQRDYSEEKSIELHDRAKAVVKRSKELKKGIKMLPDNLPNEFRKAIDGAVSTMTEEIQNEAKEIVDIADEVRVDTDNALYALRRTLEQYEKKIKSVNRFCSIPFLGSWSEKNSIELHTAMDELIELSTHTNASYESLLYSRNLVKELVKKEEDPPEENNDSDNN